MRKTDILNNGSRRKTDEKIGVLKKRLVNERIREEIMSQRATEGSERLRMG